MRKFIHLFTINIFLFFIFFLIGELTWRTVLSIKHFNNPNINYFGKTWYRSNPKKITKFDKKLKFVTKPNIFIENVDIPRWKKNSTLTTNDLGFRDNANNLSFTSNKRILAVGDSFTFGSQVSDESTWPSCLERKLKIKLDNAGVGNYSTGQSIRRAIIESEKRKYSILIWSIYFHDFVRDFRQILIRDEDNKVKFNNFKNLNKYNKKNSNFYNFLKEYSFIVYHGERVVKNIKKKFKKKSNLINQNENRFYNTDYNLIVENINFLLNKFNDIQIEDKIILYQYGADLDTANKNIIRNIKKQIEEITLNKSILIVDTLDIFQNLKDNEKHLIWFDHHTEFGNSEVCNYLLKNIKNIF